MKIQAYQGLKMFVAAGAACTGDTFSGERGSCTSHASHRVRDHVSADQPWESGTSGQKESQHQSQFQVISMALAVWTEHRASGNEHRKNHFGDAGPTAWRQAGLFPIPSWQRVDYGVTQNPQPAALGHHNHGPLENSPLDRILHFLRLRLPPHPEAEKQVYRRQASSRSRERADSLTLRRVG